MEIFSESWELCEKYLQKIVNHNIVTICSNMNLKLNSWVVHLCVKFPTEKY